MSAERGNFSRPEVSRRIRIRKRAYSLSLLLLFLFICETQSRPNDTVRVVLDETNLSAERDTFEIIDALTDDMSTESESSASNKTIKEAFIADLQFDEVEIGNKTEKEAFIDELQFNDAEFGNKTEKEAFMADLQFDDVEIGNKTRNGKKCRSDTIFLVDSSSSIHKVFDKQIQYVEKVIDELNVADDGDRVALLVFSGSSRHKMKFSFGEKQHKDLILSKVRSLPYFGGVTAAGAALDHAYQELEKRRKGPHIPSNVVVISDAFSYDTVNNQSENLRQISGVRTFAVCIENGSDIEMLVLAGRGENMLKGFDSHHELAERLQLCNDDLPQSASSTDDDDDYVDGKWKNGVGARGKHGKISKKSESGKFKNGDDVFLKKSRKSRRGKKGKSASSGSSKAGSGGKTHSGDVDGSDDDEEGAIGVDATAVEPAEEENSLAGESVQKRPVDVVIVLDGSGSLHARFHAQLEMVGQLLEALPQAPISSHISVVKFGGINRTRVLLPLNNPLSNSEIKEVLLSRLQFLGGITYAKEAFEDALAELRSSTAKNAVKVVVLFSDGFIQDDISDDVKSLHDEDVRVFSAAVTEGSTIDRQQLEVITGNPANVYTDENYGDFLKKVKTLN